jgi:hypothetical protein
MTRRERKVKALKRKAVIVRMLSKTMVSELEHGHSFDDTVCLLEDILQRMIKQYPQEAALIRAAGREWAAEFDRVAQKYLEEVK